MDALLPLVLIAIVILVIVGMIKTFMKMGYDNAWWMIIPILNIVFMLQFIEKPIWWIVIFFIPIVGSIFALYVGWLVASKVATAYGKETGFAVGLLLLGFIFYPILGFGSDQPTKTA